MAQHYAGKGSTYTSGRMPVELVWSLETLDIGAAYALERRIHGWSHPKREALVAGRLELLPALSKRRKKAEG